MELYELENKMRKAAIIYCENKIGEIIYEEHCDSFDIVVNEDDEAIVFVKFGFSLDGFCDPVVKRSDFEMEMVEFFKDIRNDLTNIKARFDTVCVLALSESNAAVRHHVNADSQLED